MAFSAGQLDRLEVDLLKFHAPKPSVGQGGQVTFETKSYSLQDVIRGLDLKGREAMIQRAYTKFCAQGVIVRSGFGYKLTKKGIDLINQIKKFQ
ncbi:hypothetical protein FJY63_06755 [Candidatus Sumerlaeota bacterium]|nr:hypothetical protein [Candidatus Sumerlaeota bacterium]